MKPAVTIKLSLIQIDNPDNSLLDAIAKKISETSLNNDGDGNYTGQIEFEQETSNEDLMLQVSGAIYQYGSTEPETNSFCMMDLEVVVDITANLNGDDVEFDVNNFVDFEEAIVIEVKKLIK